MFPYKVSICIKYDLFGVSIYVYVNMGVLLTREGLKNLENIYRRNHMPNIFRA